MGRLHSHRHGQSHSIRPVTPTSPTWVKQNVQEIEELVLKYAKDLDADYYICGLHIMVDQMKILLLENGVDKERIHLERYV